jgi:hypothetical protein
VRRLLPLLSAACVVGFDERVEIRAPVDAIDLRLGSGDVRFEAEPGPVELEGSFGGVGGELVHHVEEGVLVIRQRCRLCGGELEVTAPARTAVTASLGSGELVVQGLRGPIHLDLGAGDVEIEADEPPESVEVLLSTGDATVVVPSGRYALDLRAEAGAIDVSGVTDDPSGPPITIQVAVGGITLRGE